MSLYTDASLIMYPSGYKEDKIYSLKPTDGSGDLTFTRASTATRVNSDGLIETSPVNLFEYSQTLTNGVWVGSGATYSGDTLTASAGTSFKGIYQNQTTQGQQTVYFDVLYTNHQWVQIGVGTGASDLGYANFDLQNKVVGNQSGGFVGSIEDFGTYIRIAVIFSSVDKTSVFLCMVDSGTASRADSTSSTGNIKLYKAQLNIGATAKPYFPTTDRLNVPRIDYTGGGCGKLLLEKQSTNLMYPSEDFTNANWSGGNYTIVANDLTSPDGTQNADKFTTTSTTAENYMRISNISILANIGSSYTTTIFAKKGTGNFLRIRNLFVTNGGTDGNAWFNLNTGAVGTVQSSQTASIQDMGNGWYRCSLTGVVGSVNSFSLMDFGFTNADATNFPSANVDGYLWGAQLE